MPNLQVTVEVPVEKLIEKTVVKEVPIEKIVIKEVPLPIERIVVQVSTFSIHNSRFSS